MLSGIAVGSTIDGRTIFWFLFSFLALLKLVSNQCFSGSVQWEIKLEGRIECTAAIVSDFSQVYIFFLLIW